MERGKEFLLVSFVGATSILILGFLLLKTGVAHGQVASIPASRMVYLERSFTDTTCVYSPQQYDQFIVTADYPSGANRSYLPLQNHPIGAPALLGGANGCPSSFPPPNQPSINPSRTKIAYSKAGYPFVYDVGTQRETNGRVYFTTPQGSSFDVPCGDPQWSPDGQYLSCISPVGVPGVGTFPGVYLWDANTLASISRTPITNLPEGIGLSRWQPDSSGLILKTPTASSSNISQYECTAGLFSYRPTSLHSFSLSSQTITTILPPTCGSDWESMSQITVSTGGKIAFEGETIVPTATGITGNRVLGVVSVDGSNEQLVPINLWEMSPPNGFCGESIGSFSWETTEDALIASISGPNNDHTFCDTNAQFVNKIERVDINNGSRLIVIDRLQEGFHASNPTSTTPSDISPPMITASLSPQPNLAGWNNGPVTITFTCSDNESGIASCPDPATIDQEGAGQIVEGTATDNVGNTASTSVTLNIDKTAPVISYTKNPAPNSNGWNSEDVTVTFDCSDGLSGIESCTDPVAISSEGANQPVEGTAVDAAGNTSNATATVSIDKTNPTITYNVSPAPNQYGWNNSDVTVSFTCSDNLSGIDTCPDPITLTGGVGQIIEGTATDKAGNYATAAVMVNIDKVAPVVSNLAWTGNPLQEGQSTTLSAAVDDSLSGIAIVQYSIDGGVSQAMTYDSVSGLWKATFGSSLVASTYDIVITATDLAGNTSAGTTDILAVYNATNGYVIGHARTLPATSDILPLALDTSSNPTNLILGFTNVTSPASGSFDLTYSIKNKKDEFNLSSTSINWVVVQDSTHASILGYADMTIWVDGVMTVTQNMAVRFDITLGTNGNPDTISVKIYNPGDDPNIATPAYIINDTVIANGSNLMIHP